MSTLSKNYSKQILGSLKMVFDRYAFYPGIADRKPMTQKALIDDICCGIGREINCRNLLRVHRIYTNGIFAVRLPDSKWSDKIVASVNSWCEEHGEAVSQFDADKLVKALDAGAIRDDEAEVNGVISINDNDSYRMQSNKRMVIQVNGIYWETVQSIHKKSFPFMKTPDQPVVWRKASKDSEWMGCLMPQLDPNGPAPDDKTVPVDRWGFYQYQEFNCAAPEFDKQQKSGDRQTIPGRFIDVLTGRKSLDFILSSDARKWSLYMNYGKGSADFDLITQFNNKASAIEAVETIAAHVLSVDDRGHLHFSAKQDVTNGDGNG